MIPCKVLMKRSNSLTDICLVKNSMKKHFRLILTFCVIGLILIMAKITGFSQQFSIENIREIFENHFILATFIYILAFAIGNILQIPGWIFLSASMAAIGHMKGYVITVLAAYVSCVSGYYFIRFIGGDGLTKFENRLIKNSIEKAKEYPIRTIIVLRCIFQTAPILNYSMALSGIPFKEYFIASVIALPLPIFIYSFFIDKFIAWVTG